jgi:hypothetical protein
LPVARWKGSSDVPDILLTPREVEAVTSSVANPGSANARLLARFQGNVERLSGWLEVSDADLAEARVLVRRWLDGGERGFKAILAAADRHGV